MGHQTKQQRFRKRLSFAVGVGVLVCTGLTTAPVTQAQIDDSDKPETESNEGEEVTFEPATKNTIEPTIELLEFLGQWVTDDGEWIDPDELSTEEFAQLLDTVLIESKKND